MDLVTHHPLAALSAPASESMLRIGSMPDSQRHRYLFVLDLCAGRDVLDIGCGNGVGSACLGQVARSVVGLVTDGSAANSLRDAYADARVSFQAAGAGPLPFEGGSFDVVVAFDETADRDWPSLISEALRVLRPGGTLAAALAFESAGHSVDCLAAAFEYVGVAGQSAVTGSVIAPLTEGAATPPHAFSRRAAGLFQRSAGLPDPKAVIAVASRTPLRKTGVSLLHDPTRVERLVTPQHEAAANPSAPVVATYGRLQSETNRHLAAIRSAAQARIAALRRALDQSRHRNQELVVEVAQAMDGQDQMRARLANLELSYRALSAAHADSNRLVAELDRALAVMRASRSWRATAPMRRASALLSPPQRARLRRLAKRLRGSGQPATPAEPPATVPALVETDAATALPPPPPDCLPADDAPLAPSDWFRQRNPDWTPPGNRADFVRLREHTAGGRIAAVVHVYYTELWPEMRDALESIAEPFDLFVTLVAEVSESLQSEIAVDFPHAAVLVVDNHGRDILPFLQILSTGVLFRYEYVVKLHTKRTLWREGGDTWRQHLIAGILGDAERTEAILSAFEDDPDLGLVVADGQVFHGRAFWVSNENRLRGLLGRIGLDPSGFEQGFAGGSIFWIRPLLLRSVAALSLGFDDFEREPLPEDGATAHAAERLISLVCHDAGMRIAEAGKLSHAGLRAPAVPAARVHVIAHFLPQFHPVPENDLWWGAGFTEWTNVTQARPLFRGHRQPRLPADLGFYDLRLPATRAAQADLAAAYGVTAFSYYYYWFDGRRILERPLDEVLRSGEPDFPFMVCWANEPWTRRWDGLANDVLLPQSYAEGWEDRFAADVERLFRDRRYVRIDGAPMLAVYRMPHIPDTAAAVRRLRAAFARLGVGRVHLIGGWLRLEGDSALPPLPEMLGLDAYFEFPPHNIPVKRAAIEPLVSSPDLATRVYDYNATVDGVIDRLAGGAEGFRYRGVMAGWDNTARRGEAAYVFTGATPASLRRWLRATVVQARAEARGPETAVFINAWNEWAEGTYLEPDQTFGRGWLEAVASALGQPVPPTP